MIKLKSLFRRGPAPSQGSSSKHSSSSSSSNNNRNKSQSTQSLNTAIENEDKQQQKSSSSKFYPPSNQNPPLVNIVGSSAERGVDVGDDNSGSQSLEANKLAAAGGVHAHTLPHKKSKGNTPKKGHKQPKPLPNTPNSTADSKKAPAVIAPAPNAGNVMSSMAAVAPGTQSSSVNKNNNFGSASTAGTGAIPSSHSNPSLSSTANAAAATTANDLYALNPAFMAAAAAASYQFINNEQQQILEVKQFETIYNMILKCFTLVYFCFVSGFKYQNAGTAITCGSFEP